MRRHQQNAALSQQTSVSFVNSGDPAKVAARDVGNSIVQCETLIYKRVVGGQQIKHAALLSDDATHEQIQLAFECQTQRMVEIWKDILIRRRASQVADLEPLSSEIRHQRL